jgi:hypothetical protein
MKKTLWLAIMIVMVALFSQGFAVTGEIQAKVSETSYMDNSETYIDLNFDDMFKFKYSRQRIGTAAAKYYENDGDDDFTSAGDVTGFTTFQVADIIESGVFKIYDVKNEFLNYTLEFGFSGKETYTKTMDEKSATTANQLTDVKSQKFQNLVTKHELSFALLDILTLKTWDVELVLWDANKKADYTSAVGATAATTGIQAGSSKTVSVIDPFRRVVLGGKLEFSSEDKVFGVWAGIKNSWNGKIYKYSDNDPLGAAVTAAPAATEIVPTTTYDTENALDFSFGGNLNLEDLLTLKAEVEYIMTEGQQVSYYSYAANAAGTATVQGAAYAWNANQLIEGLVQGNAPGFTVDPSSRINSIGAATTVANPNYKQIDTTFTAGTITAPYTNTKTEIKFQISDMDEVADDFTGWTYTKIISPIVIAPIFDIEMTTGTKTYLNGWVSDKTSTKTFWATNDTTVNPNVADPANQDDPNQINNKNVNNLANYNNKNSKVMTWAGFGLELPIEGIGAIRYMMWAKATDEALVTQDLVTGAYESFADTISWTKSYMMEDKYYLGTQFKFTGVENLELYVRPEVTIIDTAWYANYVSDNSVDSPVRETAAIRLLTVTRPAMNQTNKIKVLDGEEQELTSKVSFGGQYKQDAWTYGADVSVEINSEDSSADDGIAVKKEYQDDPSVPYATKAVVTETKDGLPFPTFIGFWVQYDFENGWWKLGLRPKSTTITVFEFNYKF